MALLRVGMAEIKIGDDGDTLQALGLGSCIGLAMVDRESRIGGMVHVMLPDSSVARDNIPQVGKFANTGVPELYELVMAKGAQKSKLIVKMAGGAEMFAFSGKDAPQLQVGRRNTEAVREELKKLGLRVQAESVGGNRGRTFEVDLKELKFTIKVVGQGISEL